MTNREKFITEIEEKLNNDSNFLSKDAFAYFEELKKGKASVGGMTEVGEKVIIYLQTTARSCDDSFSAKLIGEGLFVNSRSVSGAMRKLIADGYVTKSGSNPVVYSLTQAGFDYQPQEA